MRPTDRSPAKTTNRASIALPVKTSTDRASITLPDRSPVKTSADRASIALPRIDEDDEHIHKDDEDEERAIMERMEREERGEREERERRDPKSRAVVEATGSGYRGEEHKTIRSRHDNDARKRPHEDSFDGHETRKKR